MKINEVHKLDIEEGDGVLYRFESSPNTSLKPQLAERVLVIHAPISGSLAGAVSQYTSKPKNFLEGRSRHLILSRDGKEIVQMVPFNLGAMHAFGYNGRSIAVELQYPGELRNKASVLNKNLKFNDDQYILASSLNHSHYGEWPIYPKAQIDQLFNVAKLLKERYNIQEVIGYEEVASRTDPGPAFPIHQFREKLLGITDRSFIPQEITHATSLLGHPENPLSVISSLNIPAGTPVSIMSERFDWYLVSVLAEVAGNPWLTGWVPKRTVRVKTDFEYKVNEKHYLTNEEGRRFQEITPHPNGYESARRNPTPKYIVMHFTTGTKMESTISHFKDPSSLVSTHLLIGRDGRVVQFLPFDRVAHHCGYSWWERLNNLNNYSIGIELDNAGLLSNMGRLGWMSRKIRIPDAHVKQAVHWKQFTPNNPARFPGWEKYPDAQLQVALNIVKALRDRYPSIEEILGHDDVNLRNRYDPGPLFPMPQFRLELFGRAEPKLEVFTLSRDTKEVYTNFNGRLPNTQQSLHEMNLPANSVVRVIRSDDDLALVTVVRSKDAPSLNQKTGWIRANSLSAPVSPARRGMKRREEGGSKTANQRVTKYTQAFFKRTKNNLQPTPIIDEAKFFVAGTRVRIQQVRGEWTLVVALDPLGRHGGVEGWLHTELLSPEVIS